MATQKQVVNRLKRARGQLDGLIQQLEEGDANCRDVLTQFSAVNSAISRASYLTVATIMSQCTLEAAEADAADGASENAGALADGAGANSRSNAVKSAKEHNFVKTDHITIAELEKLFLSLA